MVSPTDGPFKPSESDGEVGVRMSVLDLPRYTLTSH